MAYLTKEGYILKKTVDNVDTIELIKKELTVFFKLI